jgi:D-sedoheptulose 7-phosphate isomerase
MVIEEPSGYFGQLAQAVAHTEFTDGHGSPLSSAEGFSRVDALLGRYVLPRSDGRPGRNRGKVMLVGNGGSAAIASHIQNDLSKTLNVRALVFNDVPLLTALANDLDYDAAFEHGAALWSEIGDLMFAISSSGRSTNIVRAARAAAALGCRVVTLTGFGADNPLRQAGEINLYVPSDSYGHVEVAHLALLHCFTDRLTSKSMAGRSNMWESAANPGR